MAYKTERNKILKNTNRLIVADMNGENWACPDAYFATAYPIYDGYKVKKDQLEWGTQAKPKLHEVLKQFTNYIEPDKTERVKRDGRSVDGGEVVRLSWSGDYSFDVNSEYYDFLMGLYPQAVVKICIDGGTVAPVELHNDGALVAVIMPVRS